MLSLQHISKNFSGKKAVDDISFEVEAGKTIALLGTSGCGKTTTLRMINRLEDADAGTITINGKNIQTIAVTELRRNIGYVLQHHGLFPHYSIAENIALVPTLFGWPEGKIKLRVSELLQQLHLPENILTLFPASLSGGQQQRVGLARALAADPPLLLMDEPFGALDAVTRAEITADFKKLEILKSKTIVMVTHDIQEAIALADDIVLMHEGKLIQQGTAANLLFTPASEFVSNFFNKNRLQSELSAIPFASAMHLFPALQNDNIVTQETDKSLNLWQLLETVSKGEEKQLLQISDRVFSAGAADILNALQLFKQQLYERL